MKNPLLLFILISLMCLPNFLKAQDTTIIQTLTFDSTGRDYMFQFPADTGQSYERIVMQYRMRCKNGLVSTVSDRNKGCGEWDYSCNTYITDSSYTDSVKATAPSHTITGFSGNNFYYTSLPTYSYTQFTQKSVVRDSVLSEITATVGSGSDSLSHPFDASKQRVKVQYLWRASELLSAGLVAGDISSLRFTIADAQSNSDFLRIAMKHSSLDSLSSSAPESEGFSEVYFKNTTFVNGVNELMFYNNFNWDGSSNLLIEISANNSVAGLGNLVLGHDAGIPAGLVSNAADQSAEFSGAGLIRLGASALGAISDEITITLWCYGNSAVLPANTSIFEGFDTDGARQVNSHLPWGNSEIYWDCGNDGAYDRINAIAVDSLYEGRWNHWAFTKNSNSGSMRIYQNGQLWLSGSSKTKLINLFNLVVGASANGSNAYQGKVDDFCVWNTELSAADITEWMFRDLNATHPQYANLLAYYKMDERTGNSISDHSPTAETATIEGLVNLSPLRGRDIYKGFSETSMRPNITFLQGTYVQSISDIIVRDSIQNSGSIVTSYQIQNNSLLPLDTNVYFASGNIFVYDDLSGAVVDTILIPTEDTINISTLNYHRKSPSRFEIMSFVTPYGINLDLGIDGVMWEFDVSDFKPVLQGRKRLDMTRGGQFQEEMDIRFLFIEGTPPRDVHDVRQIWPVEQRNYIQILNDDFFEPKTIVLDSSSSMFKIRSAITGHGQEGEFIPRTHFININGGPVEFSWLLLKECADNEIFPQGGTWIYDRTGWCPGKATDLREFELSGVTPGQSMDVDYSLSTATGDSRYIVNNQLVSYGPPNFSLDARVVDVVKPSNKVEYLRDNPICQQPVVIIQNTGSSNLSSLVIDYRVVGGSTETFNWIGNLSFLETEEMVLPIPSQSFWNTSATGDEFEVTISAPNGGSDAYANNNHLVVPFTKPKVYTKPLILQYRSNLAPFENSYSIKDDLGNIVLSRSGFTANTVYYDTLNLSDGCYELDWLDSGQDGIAWWANNDGTGYVWMREIGGATHVFQPDYGAFIRQNFVLNTTVGISETPSDLQVQVFPNPGSGIFNVQVYGPLKENILLEVFDPVGSLLLSTEMSGDQNYAETGIDLSAESKGIYFLRIRFEDAYRFERLIVH